MLWDEMGKAEIANNSGVFKRNLYWFSLGKPQLGNVLNLVPNEGLLIFYLNILLKNFFVGLIFKIL